MGDRGAAHGDDQGSGKGGSTRGDGSPRSGHARGRGRDQGSRSSSGQPRRHVDSPYCNRSQRNTKTSWLGTSPPPDQRKAVRVGSDARVLRAVQRIQRVSSQHQTATTGELVSAFARACARPISLSNNNIQWPVTCGGLWSGV